MTSDCTRCGHSTTLYGGDCPTCHQALTGCRFNVRHTEDCNELRAQLEESMRLGRAFTPVGGAKVCHLLVEELARGMESRGWSSLSLKNADINGSINLDLAAIGSLVLEDCVVHGDFCISQAKISALSLLRTTILGRVKASELLSRMGISMERAIVNGPIHLENALVDGDLVLSALQCQGDLLLDGIVCKAGILLRDTKLEGAVRIASGAISGVFDLRGAAVKSGEQEPVQGDTASWREPLRTLEGSPPLGVALCGDMLHCEGSVLLDGAHLGGDLRFLNACIQGQLLAHDIHVAGSIRCNALDCRDVVIFDKATLVPPDTQGYAFSGSKIGGRLQITDSPMQWLNLISTSVGHYVDDACSRPKEGHLILDGFTYDRISDARSNDAYSATFLESGGTSTSGRPIGLRSEDQQFRSRMQWIGLQNRGASEYIPGPYTIFADFLDRRGRSHLALRVRIEREDRYASQRELSFARRAWMMFLKITVSYGHRPWLALLWLSLVPLIYVGAEHLRTTPGPPPSWTWYWAVHDALGWYWRAARCVLPLPEVIRRSWTATLAGLMGAAWSSVGVAGFLRILGKK